MARVEGRIGRPVVPRPAQEAVHTGGGGVPAHPDVFGGRREREIVRKGGCAAHVKSAGLALFTPRLQVRARGFAAENRAEVVDRLNELGMMIPGIRQFPVGRIRPGDLDCAKRVFK